MKRIAVIIPAYNEEQSIQKLLSELSSIHIPAYEIQAVVVNDASKDKTAELARQCPCVLLDLSVNLGIGGAVQTGYKYALENKFDFAVQMDGDGQHPPQELVKLIMCQQESNSNVVIGSRFITSEGFQSSGMRRFGINYLSALIRMLTGLKVHDVTSGFRLIDLQTLSLVNTYYPDEYPEPESLIFFQAQNLKITETQVEMRERQGGKSSIRAFKSIYYIFKVSLAILYTFIRTR